MHAKIINFYINSFNPTPSSTLQALHISIRALSTLVVVESQPASNQSKLNHKPILELNVQACILSVKNVTL